MMGEITCTPSPAAAAAATSGDGDGDGDVAEGIVPVTWTSDEVSDGTALSRIGVVCAILGVAWAECDNDVEGRGGGGGGGSGNEGRCEREGLGVCPVAIPDDTLDCEVTRGCGEEPGNNPA